MSMILVRMLLSFMSFVRLMILIHGMCTQNCSCVPFLMSVVKMNVGVYLRQAEHLEK